MLDLDAYLARIGLRGRPSIAEVHRAHATSIPFENLDPHRGVPVSLALEDLHGKMVSRRRGGYCFEQNLLLKAALETLGAEVDLLLARVRLGAPYGALRPRSHLVLRVRAEGASWHADVGFGAGGPLEPLPFGPGATHRQSGWRFRIAQDGPELVLQTAEGDDWVDLYGFVPEPVPLVDVETSNWFTSTHPRSPFVKGLIVSTQRPDGSRTSVSNWNGLALTEQTPAGETVTPVAEDAVPGLLASRFTLPGFVLGPNGRLVPATNG
ncbi:MAG: acetyltransferase [Solirubrobacterales bacterium]|nr:MAG: acetyltransferase [Solirubrobacterales bacterium]